MYLTSLRWSGNISWHGQENQGSVQIFVMLVTPLFKCLDVPTKIRYVGRAFSGTQEQFWPDAVPAATSTSTSGSWTMVHWAGLHSIVERPGFELVTYWSQVQHPNRSATEPQSAVKPQSTNQWAQVCCFTTEPRLLLSVGISFLIECVASSAKRRSFC